MTTEDQWHEAGRRQAPKFDCLDCNAKAQLTSAPHLTDPTQRRVTLFVDHDPSCPVYTGALPCPVPNCDGNHKKGHTP